VFDSNCYVIHLRFVHSKINTYLLLFRLCVRLNYIITWKQ